MSNLTALGNGLIVMIGNNGQIITNHHGDIHSLNPITEKDLCDISYVGNQFIVSDEDKKLYASPDGLSWEQQASHSESQKDTIFRGEKMISAISESFVVSKGDIKDIKIITPNSGTIINPSTSYLITWESRGIDYITIKYSMDRCKTWTPICGKVKNEGSYSWTVPASEIGEMQIKIEEAANE